MADGKKIKIGLVSPFLPLKDGIAIYSDNLLHGFQDGKLQIVTIGSKGSDADYVLDLKALNLRSQVQKIVDRECLSAVHFQYNAAFYSKYALNLNLIHALALSVPVIVTLHEIHYECSSIRDRLLCLLEQLICQRAAKVIVHSPQQRKFLEEKYGARNIVCIYHGVCTPKLQERKLTKTLLCFGMISVGKGVPYLIRAMKFLEGYRLILAGRFVDKAAEKQVMAALAEAATNITTYFGWVTEEQKAQYYRDADIVICPHTWAPYQSGILHNAVSYELPVVVSRTGALHEMVEVFGFGEIVPPRDPEAIAQAVVRVYDKYEFYKRKVCEYKRQATWAVVAGEHELLYHEAC